MRMRTRDLVQVAVFGALWGGLEMGLGSALHAARLPFAGAALGAAGISIALVGRRLSPRRGFVLYVAAVAALLKVMGPGSVVLAPVLGIFAEAGLVELVLALGGDRRAAFAVGGALATTWALVHPLVAQGLLAGREILHVWEAILQAGARALGLPAGSLIAAGAVLVAAHLALGGIGGVLAWNAGCSAAARLATQPEAA
jgi:hypothetical protein